MRIAFFSTLTNAPWGGSEVLWYNTAKYLVQQGHTVAAFVKQWDNEHVQLAELKKAVVEICYYSKQIKGKTILSKIYRKVSPHIFGEEMVFDSLFKWNPEFIIFSQGHSYDLGFYSYQQLQPLIKTAIPFALICQNNTDYNFIPEKEIRENITSVYEKAKKVFFVSQRNMRTAEMVLCKNLKNVEIISNSLSLSTSQVDILEMPENTEAQFASVGRLRCSHKAQNLLFDILSSEKWIKRSWKLNLYGTGEDEDYLKGLVNYLNLKDRVIFHGFANDIKKIWRNNHLLLHTSFGEGLPLALQEAMLCGRPAVVTDVGGNSELIIEGETGWLADGTTFSAFDKALERAWAEKLDWRKFGERAFKKIMEKIDLTPEKTLSDFITRTTLK